MYPTNLEDLYYVNQNRNSKVNNNHSHFTDTKTLCFARFPHTILKLRVPVTFWIHLIIGRRRKL